MEGPFGNMSAEEREAAEQRMREAEEAEDAEAIDLDYHMRRRNETWLDFGREHMYTAIWPLAFFALWCLPKGEELIEEYKAHILFFTAFVGALSSYMDHPLRRTKMKHQLRQVGRWTSPFTFTAGSRRSARRRGFPTPFVLPSGMLGWSRAASKTAAASKRDIQTAVVWPNGVAVDGER